MKKKVKHHKTLFPNFTIKFKKKHLQVCSLIDHNLSWFEMCHKLINIKPLITAAKSNNGHHWDQVWPEYSVPHLVISSCKCFIHLLTAII